MTNDKYIITEADNGYILHIAQVPSPGEMIAEIAAKMHQRFDELPDPEESDVDRLIKQSKPKMVLPEEQKPKVLVFPTRAELINWLTNNLSKKGVM